MRSIIALALIFSAFSLPVAAQTNNAATYRLDGLVSLMSNFVESGLTQTDGDPALQGSFWFNFGPQFRMGLWGGNVSYNGQDSHFLLKLNAELKVDFSPDTNMVIAYSDAKYYKSEARDGNILGLKLNLYGYGIRYEKYSNFFGTKESATSYAFSKTWPVFQTWKWENLVGYLMLDSEGLSNYFFVESYLGTRAGSVDYQIGASYNSASSQFNGAADPALILKATVTF
ncbi:MAG: TorF family putative porin [Bdellovibrionaceae bacterium]|nr:TorF family putative porin [Pseudobdellovibrionaceae bacterium]